MKFINFRLLREQCYKAITKAILKIYM